MGARGMVPKRSDQRRRRNKTDIPVDTLEVPEGPAPVPALREGLDPLAVAWYEALASSAQTRWYEPSDWAQAVIVTEAVDEWVVNRSPRALELVLKASATLLVTEGDRRRLRIELERAAAQRAASVSAIDEYRRRLGVG